MSPLDRAVTLTEPHDLALTIRKYLHLNVARSRDLPLQIERGRSESGGGLAGRTSPSGVEVLIAADNAHSLSAAAARRLEQNRIADLVRRGAGRGHIAQRLRTFGDRDIDVTRETAGRGLLAEETLHPRRWTDEHEPRIDHRLREVRILREEAVTGVDRVASRALGDLDDPRRVEVAIARRRRADRVRRVGGADVQRVAVDVAIDGDRAEAEVMAGPDDAERDLAAIGDEHGGERRSPL